MPAITQSFFMSNIAVIVLMLLSLGNMNCRSFRMTRSEWNLYFRTEAVCTKK